MNCEEDEMPLVNGIIKRVSVWVLKMKDESTFRLLDCQNILSYIKMLNSWSGNIVGI